MTKVEVDSEDLEWILTMPGWEFTSEAVSKTDEVKKRLWEAVGVKDKMDAVHKSMVKRMEMDTREVMKK